MMIIADIILEIDPSQLTYRNGDINYLYYLLVFGSYSRIHKLIRESKFNYNQTFGGKSCLEIVSNFGHNLCVDYFLELGLTSHSKKMIADSVRSDNVTYVKEWIKTNTPKRKLVVLATEFSSINVLNILLPFMTDEDIITPKHLLISAMESGSIECFKIMFRLCKFSLRNNTIDSENNTLAHISINTGNVDMIKILFKSGYDFTIANKRNISAYQMAYSNKKINKIFSEIDLEKSLIDIAVRLCDIKSIAHLSNIAEILNKAIEYEQIYIIKYLQEKNLLVPMTQEELRKMDIQRKLQEANLLMKTKKSYPTNALVILALEGRWKEIETYASNLERDWSDGRFNSINWPVRTLLNGQPILHIAFSQSVCPTTELMQILCLADPEQKDSRGMPLVSKLLRGENELNKNTLFNQKIEILNKYFPDKIANILSQADDYGHDLSIVLDKNHMDIVNATTKIINNLLQSVLSGQIHQVEKLLNENANPYKTDSKTKYTPPFSY